MVKKFEMSAEDERGKAYLLNPYYSLQDVKVIANRSELTRIGAEIKTRDWDQVEMVDKRNRHHFLRSQTQIHYPTGDRKRRSTLQRKKPKANKFKTKTGASNKTRILFPSVGYLNCSSSNKNAKYMDPILERYRLKVNEKQSKRTKEINDMFQCLSNAIPNHVTLSSVKNTSKLGVLLRAINYIDELQLNLTERVS